MPNPHFDIAIVKRSEGRSAIAGAAYGDVKMDQNANQNKNRQPCFRKVIGNTTYVVRVHFSETSKETLEGKIKG